MIWGYLIDSYLTYHLKLTLGGEWKLALDRESPYTSVWPAYPLASSSFSYFLNKYVQQYYIF